MLMLAAGAGGTTYGLLEGVESVTGQNIGREYLGDDLYNLVGIASLSGAATMNQALDPVYGAMTAKAEVVLDGSATGYHATKPEYAESIRATGFRESSSGRAGGGGVYVNNTPEGAVAEYSKYNSTGPEPTLIEVKYNSGVNVMIENPGSHTREPLPIYGNTLTFESTQLPGTYNTIIRNGSISIR